jgi:hypothetical protein
MRPHGVLAAGVGLGLVAAALLRAAQPAPPARVPERLIRAKIEHARKTYELVWLNNKEALVPFAEVGYRWSRRWLEAELERGAPKAEQAAAYQAHWDRMRSLARITRERYKNRVNPIEEVTAADFYVTEAEIWVEQAKVR